MSDVQIRNLFDIMACVVHDVRYCLDQQLDKFNLSKKEWMILGMLRSRPDGLSQKWAKMYIDIEPSYFTKMLNDLEDKDLIIREIDKRDRRNRIIKVNPKSSKTLKKIFAIFNEINENVLSDLSKSQHDHLFKSIDAVKDKLHCLVEEV